MIEVISYRIGAGFDSATAKRRQFHTIEQCLQAARAAASSGQIWMAPITRHGTGRWIFVGRYDGKGRVFLGLEDEEATADGFLAMMRFRLQ